MFVGLADGFCKQGSTGGSYLIYKVDNFTTVQNLNNLIPIIKNQMYSHPKECRTSNNAEARTLRDLIERLQTENILHPTNDILVLSDSQVCIRLIKGEYKCHSPALKAIIQQIWQIGQRFKMLYDAPISTTLKIEHISGVDQKAGPIAH